MKTLTYMAVLHKDADGYSVLVPDLPGCYSFGSDLADVARMTEGAINLHIYGLENDGEKVPEPSPTLSDEDVDGGLVMPITVHPDIYRSRRQNERVRTNVTIPLWLKQEAEARKVNYSRVMEQALIEYLNIGDRAAAN